MNLEDIMLSDISQSPKDKHCVIPFIRGPWRGQIHRDRKQAGGGQGLGVMGVSVSRGRSFSSGDAKGLEVVVVMSAQQRECASCH